MAVGKKGESGWQEVRKYANLGTELVVAVLLGAWGGRALDQWLDTAPWLFILGFIFGVAAGFLNIFRLVSSKKISRNKERKS